MGRSGGGPGETTITTPFEVDVLKYGTAAAAGTALTAALAAVDVTKHTRLAFPTASALTWDSTPALPRGITGSLAIDFKDSLVTLTAGGLRLLDFNKVADFDAFQNIEVGHVTVDAASLSGTSHDHVVIGTLVAGVIQTRVNFDQIYVHDVTTINVAVTDSSHLRENICLASANNTVTQCTLTNILVERVHFSGGAVGIAIIGQHEPAQPGSTVNVYCDNVTIRDWWHSPGAVAVASAGGANIQVGGYATCGTVDMGRGTGLNSSDVGGEFDNIQFLYMQDPVFQDAFNYNYLFYNFLAPALPKAQKYTLVGCKARKLLQTVGTSNGFQIDAATGVIPPSVVFGAGCSFDKNNTTMDLVAGLAVHALNGPRAVEFQDFSANIEGGSYAVQTTALNSSAILVNAVAGSTTRVTGRARIRFSGFRDPGGGVGTVEFTGVIFGGNGSTAKMAVDLDVTFDELTLTNASSASLRGYEIGQTTMTLWGKVVAKFLATTGDTGPRGVTVFGTSTLTIQNQLVIGGDFSGLPSGATDVLYGVVGATNRPSVSFVPKTVWHGGVSSLTTVVTATNASWPIPPEATLLRITAVGGGGGGGGGGASSSQANQVGGSGGCAAMSSSQVVSVGANTTLNVTVGAGGAGGGGGSAGGGGGSNASTGGDSTVTGTGISVTGKAGTRGIGGGNNTNSSASAINWGSSGVGNAGGLIGGFGGPAQSTGGVAGGDPIGYSGGGGAGGAATSATLGGLGGNKGTAVAGGATQTSQGGAGTTAGVNGVSADANTGAGGGGGGGGAWNGGTGPGAGGNGGTGGSGYVVIEVLG